MKEIRKDNYVFEASYNRDVEKFMTKKYNVFEIFGPTIQGEGKFIGRATYFLRFAGCDNKCTWCDTAKAQILPESKIDLNEILNHFNLNECSTVTITGGNPCIYDLTDLIEELHVLGFSIFVETQGTKWQPWLKLVDYISISPKSFSSGNVTSISDITKFHASVVEASVDFAFKVVVATDEDFSYVESLVDNKITNIILQVADDISSEYTLEKYVKSYQELIEVVLEKAKVDLRYRDITILPQLHKVVWGRRERV